MGNGIPTQSLAEVSLSDTLVVNKDGSTGQQKVADLATQMSGSGALKNRFEGVEGRTTEAETRIAQQEVESATNSERLDGLEGGIYAEAIPYPTVEDGLLIATEVGQRFKVDNADAQIAFDVYERLQDGTARFVDSHPSVLALSLSASAIDNANGRIDATQTAIRAFGKNFTRGSDLKNCTLGQISLENYGGSFAAPARPGAPNWTFRRGGGDFAGLYVVDGEPNIEAGTDRAFRADMVRNATDGDRKSDLQIYQLADIPEDFLGAPFSVEITFWYKLPAGVTMQCLAMLGTDPSNVGASFLYGELTNEVILDNTWRKAVGVVNISQVDITQFAVGPRVSAKDEDLNASAYIQGISTTFGGRGRTEFTANLPEEMGIPTLSERVEEVADQIASAQSQVDDLEDDIATIQAQDSARPNMALAMSRDAWGNLKPTFPAPKLLALGDSQTDAMAEALASAIVDLEVIDFGIGGEKSSEILARFQGYQFKPVQNWAAGTVRLRATRAIPPRTVEESRRNQWVKYARKIAEPSFVRFSNRDGQISQTIQRLKATATVAGETWYSAAHSLQDGDVVHFREETGPANAYPFKPYFVRESAADSFKLAEFETGPAVVFDPFNGSLNWLGDFYFDWVYNGTDDTNITCETHAASDHYHVHICVGTNDFGGYYVDGEEATLARVQSNLQAMVAQLKSVFVRVSISQIPGFHLGDGTWASGGIRHGLMTRFHEWLAASYPDNYLPVYPYLLGEGNGSPEDQADVAQGYVPRSLRNAETDGHLNSTGRGLWVQMIKDDMIQRGWIIS